MDEYNKSSSILGKQQHCNTYAINRFLKQAYDNQYETDISFQTIDYPHH